jgi:cytochrome c-type biogenesis protein
LGQIGLNASLSLAVALGAGLASFLLPCVLPLIPIYLAQLVGPGIMQSSKPPSASRRFFTFLHALCFVLGFSLIFIALGATASVIGHTLQSHQLLLRQVGGVILVILGLHFAGLLRIPWLYRTARVQYRPGHPSFPASCLMGVIFAIGWTPCVGVILSSILILASNSATLQSGVALLAVYSLGLGFPFLALGLAVNVVSLWLKRLKSHLGKIEVATGLLLAVVGIAMFFGLLTYLPQYFNILPGQG